MTDGGTMDIEFSFKGDSPQPQHPPPLLSLSDVQRPQPQPQQQSQSQASATHIPPPPSRAAPQPRPALPPKEPKGASVDHSFLDSLANKRKVKSNVVNKASNFMGAHDNLDLYTNEDAALAEAANRERLERMRRLRREAEIEASRQNLPAPLNVSGPAGPSGPAKSSSSSGRNANMDDATFAKIMGAKASAAKQHSGRHHRSRHYAPPPSVVSTSSSDSEAASRRYHASRRAAGGGSFAGLSKQRRDNDDDDDSSTVFSDDDDDFFRDEPPVPQKTAAELYLEERQHKARRVARIEQLESKGIKCSLPDDVEWMSLPLAQVDDALLLMETMYKRKGRILKMRAGFYGLNKALVYGATNHPGPEFLKFYKVKGFDKTLASEIDEFDDDLEKLYEMWFGEGGEMHPLLSILLIEATMLGNHVMKQTPDGDAVLKTTVADPGTASKGNGSASQNNLLTNMLSMLSKNPAMSGAVQSVVGAAAAQPTTQQSDRQNNLQNPPPFVRSGQQQQGQQGGAPTLENIFKVRDYGAPPGAGEFDPAVSREFQVRDQQIRQLEEKLRQQTLEATRLRENSEVATAAARSQQHPAAAVRTQPGEDTEELRLLMDNLVSRHVSEDSTTTTTTTSTTSAERPASLTVDMPPPPYRARGGRGGARGRGGSSRGFSNA